jgi:TetR/AcrR family transcriptional repressor of nem operon
MRVTKQRAAENRERVIEEAAKLFREKGFDGVGVVELMSAAGLTHGGFYNHFGCKDDLEAAALGLVFERSVERIAAIAGIADADQRARAFVDYCERYVSPAARDASAASCPMVAFAGDVSRQGEPVREAYAQGLATYLEGFAKASGRARAQALREFATLAGALTLARSVAASRPELSEEILAAARPAAEPPSP